MNEINVKFGNWLYKKYTEWLVEQADAPEYTKGQIELQDQKNLQKRNMSGYCSYINISRAMFSEYIHHHRIPTRRTIHAIAAIYGDEVYELVGIIPPPKDAKEVFDNWNMLDENEKTKILALIRSKKER